MQGKDSWLTIGALAQRAGVATSAVRFYEAQGLLRGSRSEGNQRRYAKETLRRVAFIR
ncbi:MAG TPA: MerR family DNA-binding transcriptional regulator, partial [Piscinibacter sp.]|nr:MerR family DNA-binding transcriptional regulator [Piscinibacter sp.]